jgi:protoporphyrinogen oxidase
MHQATRTVPTLRIAVIGGGIAGLASAYFLLQQGYAPVLFEASDHLGGLARSFEYHGQHLDCFYHVILDSDDDLCGLIRDLGLADRLIWRETGMGFHVGGRLYGFNTPLDVLRFGALSLPDRLRTGLGALYITKIKKHGLDLDAVRASQWLRAIFGPRVFERIWTPLLRAKFGERLESVPAYWVWNTLTREKNGKQEVKGYLRGGYHALVERLRQVIVAGGGEIRFDCPVKALAGNGAGVAVESHSAMEHFDAAVSTLPLALLAKVVHGDLARAIPLPDLMYQGVVNALVISRRPLERFYWTIVVDPAFPFQGVVETTHVIPPAWIGNRHLIYVMNYCGANSDTYRLPDDLVKRQAVDGLCHLYKHFHPDDVEDVFVFRAPFVEPVWTVGYLQRRPAPRVGDSRLYLSTTAQAYPRVTAWNTSVAVSRETVVALAADLREGRAGDRRAVAA